MMKTYSHIRRKALDEAAALEPGSLRRVDDGDRESVH
jgi:hypothetical protein